MAGVTGAKGLATSFANKRVVGATGFEGLLDKGL